MHIKLKILSIVVDVRTVIAMEKGINEWEGDGGKSELSELLEMVCLLM
jgi:hypothetical protein